MESLLTNLMMLLSAWPGYRDDSDDDGAVGSDEDGEDESARMSNK